MLRLGETRDWTVGKSMFSYCSLVDHFFSLPWLREKTRRIEKVCDLRDERNDAVSAPENPAERERMSPDKGPCELGVCKG